VAERARAVSGVIATTLIELADPETFDRLARTRVLGRLARWGFRWLAGFLDRLALPLWWMTPLGTLTTDPALRQALLADPLLGRRRVSLGFFRSLHQYAPSLLVPRLTCPLLVLHPGADEWTPTEMTRAVFDRMDGDKKMVELSNGAHAPLESPAFTELGREVTTFLNTVVAAPAPVT
jgi:pimeloyl-ACP methyl ester carboxylesterase